MMYSFWIYLAWILILIILKFIKPGIGTWVFVCLILLNIFFYYSPHLGLGFYNPIYFIAPQVLLVVLHRNKIGSVITPSKSVIEHSQPPVNVQNIKKNIFINYRKEDSSGYSLALYHELIKWYHKDSIFKDFNTIEPGEDFEEAIDKALNGASVLIVLIGDKWSDILNIRGKKNQKDFVRIEIATALSKSIYTIPVTINGTPMPQEEGLPDDLIKLTHRQFLNIDQTRFDTDILKLVRIIDKKLGIDRTKVD